MAPKVNDIIQAHCSQCKDNGDAEIMAVVGSEIVTVTCKTCGTSQRYRPPIDPKNRPASRRVVDVGSGSDSPRPRARTQRRVISSTGREIVDDTPPRPPLPPLQPITAGPPATAARPNGMSHMKDDDLFKRWQALTTGVLSRHGRPHRAHESYRPGEVVLHTVHGMGIVEEIAADGTLTVLFKRGYHSLPSRPKDAEPAPA